MTGGLIESQPGWATGIRPAQKLEKPLEVLLHRRGGPFSIPELPILVQSPGGTDERFNWNLAVEAQKWGRPIFLAGGLTAENVAQAVAQVRPYGVDVSGGVEAAPGKKDHAKVKAFNLLLGRAAPAGPDEVWVADIT